MDHKMKSVVGGRFLMASSLALHGMMVSSQFLDPLFGSGGRSTTNFNFNEELVQFMQITPDGKILTGGRLNSTSVQEEDRWFMARFLPDGTSDPSFSADGFVILNPCIGDDVPLAMLQGNDGYTYMVGYEAWAVALDMPPNDQATMCRVDQNGVQDMGYGSNGFMYFHLMNSDTQGFCVGPASNGMNVLFSVDADLNTVYLARVLPTGFDTDFGTSGINSFQSPEDPTARLIMDQAIPSASGGFFVFGTAYKTGVFDHLAIAKVDENGDLDPSFSDDGWIQETEFEGDSYSMRAVEDVQGRLLVYSRGGGNKFIRYLPNGDRDLSFGSNGGVVPFPVLNPIVKGLAVDENGRILASTDGNKLYMFSDTGEPILGFGVDGVYTIPPLTGHAGSSGGVLHALPGGAVLLARRVLGPVVLNHTSTWLQLTRIVYDISTPVNGPGHVQPVPLYPNPASTYVTLPGSEHAGPFELVVMDVTGREVIHRTLDHDATMLNVSHLSPGKYLLRTVRNSECEIHSFIKE